MDEKQFAEFMKLQQTMVSQLLQMGTPTASPAQSATVNATLVPNFEPFDEEKELYKNYIQRFKNYVSMKNITSNPEYCVKLLLNSIGSSKFSLVSALASPKAPNDLKYDALLSLLEKHLSPKKNILVAQHQFLSKYQSDHQSIAEYVAVLRTDINECEFVSSCQCRSSVAELFLRAQFIRGIKDNYIRERLLQSSTSKFDEIVTQAISIEAAKVDARELSGQNTNDIPEVNKVFTSRRSDRNNKPLQGARTQNRNLNYQQLGIAGLCLRCGRNNHFVKDCRTNKANLKCNSCNKNGHVAKVCISTLLGNSTNAISEVVEEQKEEPQYGVYNIMHVYRNNSYPDSDRYYVNVQIEGKPFVFEVDSGSKYTLIPRNKFYELQLPNKLLPSQLTFSTYLHEKFLSEGKTRVNVECNGNSINDDMYVVPEGCAALMGRSWIRGLKINLADLDKICANVNVTDVLNKSEEVDKLKSEFSTVFEEKIGCIPNYKVSLKLRENVIPVYTKERPIPYSLTDRVDKELDTLEKAGIITKTSKSDWGSPLVVIPKVDGGVRLCVDYKVGVNQRLVNSHYPIRKIDHIFNSLSNSRYFCRLDLYKAYLHVPVDEESSIIQTISTHRGTYRMNRLSFGVKTAPAEFNRIIDQILRDIPKTESYFDDIIVHGKSMVECKENLRKCLSQLEKFDLHLNVSKCSFFDEKIEFLGHTIEQNRVQKSCSKVKSILEIPTPTSVDELRRFLGMVTYYSRFIPNASTITSPMRHLLRDNAKFIWSTQCQDAFEKLKKEIASDRVLMPFNPNLPVQLTCDASPKGIACVLSHLVDDEEKPIAFASRTLTVTEQNYSQLDREALAIVFAIQRFHEYVFGRPFKLVTDNQPLSRIFHQNSKLPQMTSARLQRYAAFLSGYNYEVVAKRSDEIVHVDCLSRATVESRSSKQNAIDQEVHLICNSTINQINSRLLNFKTVQEETSKDAILSELMYKLRNNQIVDSEFTIDSDILFKGQRVVIPKSLQQIVLQELHYTHVGITKMKQLARRYVFWTSIDKDIEKYVRSCSACASIQNSPPKTTLHPWEEPEHNWQRVHMDYAGPYHGRYFLVVVDAKSKWAEVGVCTAAPSSSSTIDILQTIFSRNGYPEVLVSDNATIFTSNEFTTFCNEAGIFQKFIAPGHPATNGLAERNVQTLKKRLAAMTDENISFQKKVKEIMFRYRATPLQNGKTPAEQYLGRQIRIRLDAIKPTATNKTTGACMSSRQLKVGDRIQSRYYTANKEQWKFGIIIEKLGHLHYMVKLDDGYILKRHIDQLRLTSVQNSCEGNVLHKDDHECGGQTMSQETQQALLYSPIHSPIDLATDVNRPGNEEESATESTNADHNDEVPNQPLPRKTTRLRKPPQRLRDYVLGDEVDGQD